MTKILVAGAGGFIGGYLVKELISAGHDVIAVDIKEFSEWYQIDERAESRVQDLSLLEECISATKDVGRVFNLAADMGGMGFIENNKAACMLSVLVNTHLLLACKENGVSRYFLHLAPVFTMIQSSHLPIIRA